MLPAPEAAPATDSGVQVGSRVFELFGFGGALDLAYQGVFACDSVAGGGEDTAAVPGGGGGGWRGWAGPRGVRAQDGDQLGRDPGAGLHVRRRRRCGLHAGESEAAIWG